MSEHPMLLTERTLKRDRAVWHNWDITGLATDLLGLERLVNQTNKGGVRQGMAIIDGAAAFQAEQRDKLHALDMLEAEQDRQLAYDKYLTQQQELAYKIAGEEYRLAARRYEVAVQDFIMAAKEFAAQIERDETRLQKLRAEMDIDRAAARLDMTQAQILGERVEQANVEVEIARSQLKVAEANVRAIKADVEVKRAEMRTIETDLEISMTEVEEASLVADIAHIWADILIRGLAGIRLEVETAEIDAAFRFVQQRLDDMLNIWTSRIATEEARADGQEVTRREVKKQTALARAIETLKITEVEAQEEVFEFEKEKIETQTECETLLRDNVFDKRKSVAKLKTSGKIASDNIETWAKNLVNAARRAVNKKTIIRENIISLISQAISKGFISIGAPGGSIGNIPGYLKNPPDVNLTDEGVSKESC